MFLQQRDRSEGCVSHWGFSKKTVLVEADKTKQNNTETGSGKGQPGRRLGGKGGVARFSHVTSERTRGFKLWQGRFRILEY